MSPAFLAEKELQVGRKSYLSYTCTASVFSQWLHKVGLHDKPMRKITEQNIADYFLYLANERKSDRPTCQKYFITLRVIFRYAKKKGEIDVLPFDRDLIVFPRKRKDNSAALIPQHLVPTILKDIREHDPQLFMGCMMMFYCGTRPGREIRLVRVRDFDLTGGVLTIPAEHAKNGHTGKITLSDDFIQICKDYGMCEADPSLYVFGRNKHFDTRPLSENMLRYRFNKYRDKYNLSHDVKLYSWKHMGASYLVHSKLLDILQLKDHLRHSNITMTQHYVKRIAGENNELLRTQFPNPLKQAI